MRRCIDCEYYKPFQGVYECWNRDSDFMYKPTLPDDSCPEFDKKDASRPGANAQKQQTRVYYCENERYEIPERGGH